MLTFIITMVSITALLVAFITKNYEYRVIDVSYKKQLIVIGYFYFYLVVVLMIPASIWTIQDRENYTLLHSSTIVLLPIIVMTIVGRRIATLIK